MRIAIIRGRLETAEQELREFDSKFRQLMEMTGGQVVRNCKTLTEYHHPLLGLIQVHALSYKQMICGLRFDAIYESDSNDSFHFPPLERLKP